MTQVWMYRNSDTDIHVFNRREHLKASVQISYCRCEDVKIAETELNAGFIFVVTGTRDGVPFEDTLEFKRLPVWTEPCHL